MNTRAMQKGVQQQLNAMDIPLVSEDIVYYLNRAQEQFIDEQYVILRGKYTDNQNIELYTTSQKAIENLRTIIKTDTIESGDITPAGHFMNAKQFSLPDDFYYYIRSQTKISIDDEWVNSKLMEQENIQKYVQTKYNSPIFRDFLVLLEGTLAYVFYDTQTDVDVHSVALTYIKTPMELVLQGEETGVSTIESELPRHTHRDIIRVAVDLIRQDNIPQQAQAD